LGAETVHPADDQFRLSTTTSRRDCFGDKSKVELRSVFAGQEWELIGVEEAQRAAQLDRRLVLVAAESPSDVVDVAVDTVGAGSDSVGDRRVDEPAGAAGG
jgi:hypothetical protein